MCTIKYGGFVVPGRVELPTSTLSVWRSNQLSYRTEAGTVSETFVFNGLLWGKPYLREIREWKIPCFVVSCL